ncbi:MAG TPA: ABC transporter permease [Dinghuibacter sp.]|uniref:ABC transporter permease n=1 Tax=Dinghuibacter sp. TaxID=2024697 RepID=UPI002BF4F601|nr:ABC transporter permease [Dinghuibacter sp.]HTJ14883.1 ABC transporter permease [Dinghuibacter sp.]
MKDKDHIWKLVARKLSGEATPAELAELDKLLEEDESGQYSLELLSALWNPEEAWEGTPAEEATDRLQLRLDELPPGPTRVPAPVTPPRRRWLPAKSLLATQFKTTYRNLLRSRTFSLVNIFGLAVGMASALLLLIEIHNYLTFDRIYDKEDRIYQVYNRAMIDGRLQAWSGTPKPLRKALRAFPEVEHAARTQWIGSIVFNVPDSVREIVPDKNHIFETNGSQFRAKGYVTDPDFFSIFNLPFQEGDPVTALARPHSIVLGADIARKLFGDADPLGKTIAVDSNVLFTVTGLLKPLPPNTRFHDFTYYIPWSYAREVGWDDSTWINNSVATYVLLRKGVSQQTADRLFAGITNAHDPTVKNQLFLHPARLWMLYSNFENGVSVGGAIYFVRILCVIAAFILLIACINYMNLSTARSIRRAREVGIRKVMGAGKGSLIWQFLGESTLLAFLSGIVALGMAQLFLPVFNGLLFEYLYIPYADPRFWLYALGFVLFTGLLAGSYPALYLSGYHPIQVLKGTFKNALGMITPRKFLVVFQFTIAIMLVICTLVIYREVWYARHRDSGYIQKNLYFVYINGDIRKNYAPIEAGLEASGAVSDLTRSNSPITDIWSDVADYEWRGKPERTRMDFTLYQTDRNFIKTTGIKLLSGRDIDVVQNPADTDAVLLSEGAVRTMGFKHPLGEEIRLFKRKLHVIGVVANFVASSPYSPIWPAVIQGSNAPAAFGALTFRLTGNTSESLKKVEEVFRKYNPNYPFELKIVNEQYDLKLEGEERLGTLAALFSGLAICISFLGLFALAAYMAESRIREIGIRRVLGASITNIAALLSADFIKLIFIAFVIASPAAWWAMHSWLSDYAYRVSMGWWVFIGTGAAAILVALATVGYQAVNAARVSPAESLKAE